MRQAIKLRVGDGTIFALGRIAFSAVPFSSLRDIGVDCATLVASVLV